MPSSLELEHVQHTYDYRISQLQDLTFGAGFASGGSTREHMTRTSRSGGGGCRAARSAATISSPTNARSQIVPVTAFPSQRDTSSQCCLHSRRRHSRAHSPAQRQATKRRSQRSGRRGTQRKLAGRRV